MSIGTTSASIYPEDAAIYHADDSHESATRMKQLDESPQAYKARFIDKTLPFEDTPAMRFGRIFHAFMLERETFEQQCPMLPRFELDAENMTTGKNPRRSTSKSTEYYQSKVAAFEAQHSGKDLVKQGEFEQLLAMRQAVMEHDDARDLMLASGLCEHVIRWEYRIFRRARLDKVIPSLGVIVDFKTMADDVSPFAFAREAYQSKWYLQAAWYEAGAMEVYQQEFRTIFICCSKKPPYEVATHQISDEVQPQKIYSDREWSEREVERLVGELIDRRQSGNWKAGYQVGTNHTPLPHYSQSDFWKGE